MNFRIGDTVSITCNNITENIMNHSPIENIFTIKTIRDDKICRLHHFRTGTWYVDSCNLKLIQSQLESILTEAEIKLLKELNNE